MNLVSELEYKKVYDKMKLLLTNLKEKLRSKKKHVWSKN
jgi:hypothetical protein